MNSALSDDTERKYPDIRDTQNCDAFHQSNLNTSSSSPNHSQPSPSLQPAVKITDKDDGCVDNKNSQYDVSDRHLQNCDISISPPGIINTSSSTSCYVYTKKSEISKNHFEETVRTKEISSFYDISNSSTVWTFLEIYWEINSFFITSTLYWGRGSEMTNQRPSFQLFTNQRPAEDLRTPRMCTGVTCPWRNFVQTWGLQGWGLSAALFGCLLPKQEDFVGFLFYRQITTSQIYPLLWKRLLIQ